MQFKLANWPKFILAFLFAISLINLLYAAESSCKTCDFTYILMSTESAPVLTNQVNVTAQLFFITVPEGRDPRTYIQDIQAGKLNVEQVKDYVPTGPIPDQELEVYYRQDIAGNVFMSPKCIKKTDANGAVRCEVDLTGAGTQGCGEIYTFYNGTEKYQQTIASSSYCARYTVPFATLLGPECPFIILFIGILIAGMYAMGRNPIGAFDITKSKAKTTPSQYPPYKYKRYSAAQVNQIGKTIGSKLKLAQKAQKITSLTQKLSKMGYLSLATAATVKSMSPEEKSLNILMDPKFKNLQDQYNKSNMVKSRLATKINLLSTKMKASSGYKKEVLEANLKKAKEEHAQLQKRLETEEPLRTYGQLMEMQKLSLKSTISQKLKEMNESLDAIKTKNKWNDLTLNTDRVLSNVGLSSAPRKEILKEAANKLESYKQEAVNSVSPNALLSQISDKYNSEFINTISMGIKKDAISETLKSLEKINKPDDLYVPYVRAKLLAEEVSYSAVLYAEQNKMQMAENYREILGKLKGADLIDRSQQYSVKFDPSLKDDFKELDRLNAGLDNKVSAHNQLLKESFSKSLELGNKYEDSKEYTFVLERMQENILDIYKSSAELREQVEKIQNKMPSISQAANSKGNDSKQAVECLKKILK